MENPDINVIRSKRKTISLFVDKNGCVIVKAPYFVSKKSIDSFVEKNKQFIEKHRQRTLEENERAERLGAYTKDDIKRMKDIARKAFPDAVGYYAGLIGVKFGKITVRRQTTRWGSCSPNGNISLNILLCDCPDFVLRSVAAHEVCHLKVKNHGKEFYNLLYGIFPEYDEARNWLNRNGNLLQRRYDLYLKSLGGT